MTSVTRWRANPRRAAAGGVLVCGLLAALFLAPGLVRGGFGPGDLLLSMTPWNEYRDRFPDIQGVHNPQLDVIQQYFPWRIYAADCLRRNQLPLWNPHAYCGQPFVGNVLSAVFYPFGWLAAVLPIGRFFLLSAWFHLTLLGGGMWLLLREHRLRWPGALTGAVAVMFNPFVVGWLHYAPISQWTFAWAPLLLCLWHRAWVRRRPDHLPWTGLVLATVMLGGHLQIAVYVGLAWFTYALGMAVADRRPRDLPLYVAAPGALAVGLAMLQVAPALEMARLSGRAAATYESTASGAMPLRSLIALIAPWFYGRNTLNYWGPGANTVEMSFGSTAAVFWLAVSALCWRRQRGTWLFAAIALVGLLLALRSPLYWLCWHLVPGFKALSGLPRAMCLWSLGASALAGFGVEALSGDIARPCPKRVGAIMLAGTVAALLAAWAGEAQRSAPNVLTAFTPGCTAYALVQSAVALAGAAVLGHLTFHRLGRLAAGLPLLVAAELFYLGAGQSTGVRPDVFFPRLPETDFLTSRAEPFRMIGVPGGRRPPFLDWMPMNTPMAYGLSSPSGSESLSYAPYRQLLNAFCEPGWEPKLGHPLLNLVGARYVLSTAALEGQHGLRRVGGERVGVFENPAALPLLFVTSAFRKVEPSDTQRSLFAPDYDTTVALVPPSAELPESSAGGQGLAAMRVQAPSPQRWIGQGSVERVSVAVLTQTRVPGWHAWVNGRPAPVWTTDAVFCGTRLEPGAVTVRWVWMPMGFRTGLFVSLLSLMVAVVWWLQRPRGIHERATAC